ncbi:MAG: VUT family protein [Duodenibacillus sp.]|nr:VUT family protein [Duodenibacillus sp.]
MSHIAEHAGAEARRWTGWLAVIGFILTIPLGNWVVVSVGVTCPPGGPCLVPVWPGVMAPSAVLLAGLALVLRDAVHECLGAAWAAACIALGAAASALFSEPSLVIASAAAFLFSEAADFAVYAPMRKRFPGWAVVASGLAGSAVDSMLFLQLAFGSLDYVAGHVLGKFWMSLAVGAAVGWLHGRKARRALGA